MFKLPQFEPVCQTAPILSQFFFIFFHPTCNFQTHEKIFLDMFFPIYIKHSVNNPSLIQKLLHNDLNSEENFLPFFVFSLKFFFMKMDGKLHVWDYGFMMERKVRQKCYKEKDGRKPKFLLERQK